MARNFFLKPRTALDIDRRIERVLRGLGDPQPPLDLASVRELLRLDRGFYTADDPGLLREAASRVRIGALQVALRPALLAEAIRKHSLQALYLPDQKRILLDRGMPALKHRWSEAHEIGHSLLPWHDDAMLGDNAHTLSQDCREQVEAEANFAAGRLLFLRERFREEALASQPGIAAVQALRGRFGNTLASTLWRFVESAGEERPIVGMVSCHPHATRRPSASDPAEHCRYFLRSPAFASRFNGLDETTVFTAAASYCGSQRGGLLGTAELPLRDDAGEEHLFRFETFFNTYDALTMGVHLGRRSPSVFAEHL